jgi:hypothetical protein
MKLTELKKEIEKYQYFEDTNIIDVSLATIIATRLKLGDPIWLVVIGPSSGGKSQILRPLSLTDPKFIHRVDDLTESTFLSGAKGVGEASLLNRIGPKGIIVMSDLTVLFSKAPESRSAIMSQFRMIYDGEMIKSTGNSDKPLVWKGHLGVIAGCTPSVYRHFEELADMGERFIYYRMKDFSPEKATSIAMNRTMFGKELDETLANLYADYIKEVVSTAEEHGPVTLSEETNERIKAIATFAERVRTPISLNWDGEIDRIPVAAMPMRVSLQLVAVAKAISIIRRHETGSTTLKEKDWLIIEWLGWSLANEEKRACMKVLGSIAYAPYINTSQVADKIGLSTAVTRNILQNLTAVGVVERTGSGEGLSWRIKNKADWEIVRRIEKIKEHLEVEEREVSEEEDNEEHKRKLEKQLEHF